MKTYVSVDIGGTAIKYGLISEDGEILVQGKTETEAHLGGGTIVKKVTKIVKQYSAGEKLSGICISTAGMVDVEKGEIFYSAPLIPDYTGTQWKQVMETAFGIPCEVENDVNCAGLAESISGAAKGRQIAVCLTIGTGIGGCILMDRRVFRGYGNSACEIGYMHMDGSDFQSLGASSVLCRKVCERKGAVLGEWGGFRIFEEAKKGDAVCIQPIDEMTDVLGKGIANLCYVLNPQIVVLGGGVMEQEAYLKPRIRKALDRYLIPALAEKTELQAAVHKNNAGMLGAFYHFLIHRGSRL